MAAVIGLTCDGDLEGSRIFLNSAYVAAVSQAGGIPLLLPPGSQEMAEEYLKIIDGLLLTGGGDVDPRLYGEEPKEGLGRVLRERDTFELYITRRALLLGKPILAICRGMQLLNVAAGGTLYQDIVRELGSSLHNPGGPRSALHHRIEIQPGTLLYKWLGGQVKVNSMHHQAVRSLGQGLRVSATSEDGLIEAVEGTGEAFVVGVQWHPEELTNFYPEQRNLFKNFVVAADIST
ncbi:putative glutamine amidotransferase [Thermanaeromonas toyohensis ToBE]|uniref:Putative glutamine amidotransferase n=1 Tax=Thermanaeromonas toyohensis ToBE TaxID=698762 RepID=A0A1W1VCT3_9FIRM|nr:gamma-glutamyl-gamma-aminobutyrate hydrolase family protein [Thermanaeromonas toyohensis]SMB91023.1 putative glutamine amidotransferase [Thermanaeromonas toyohensis ToBE]